MAESETMSRTKHHRHQRRQHMGQDYWSRMACNKWGALYYGVHGRNIADSERRIQDKSEVATGINEAISGLASEKSIIAEGDNSFVIFQGSTAS